MGLGVLVSSAGGVVVVEHVRLDVVAGALAASFTYCCSGPRSEVAVALAFVLCADLLER